MTLYKYWQALVLSASGAWCSFSNALADSSYSIGAEGFIDRFTQSSPNSTTDAKNNGQSGSVTGSYTYGWDTYLASFEARASYGETDYKSGNGSTHGVPQYETEERLLGGMRMPVEGGHVFIPYIGLGSRFSYDNGKGSISSLLVPGYDTRVAQLYLPLGFKMEIHDDDWIYKPSLEYDQLLFGRVNSRRTSVVDPAFPTLYNTWETQTYRGYGLRTEVTVGQQYSNYGWDAGPFVRYWNIQDSKPTTDAGGNTYIEPHSSRIQAGASVRFNF